MSAAARLYFDKRPPELTLPEAALLAGLIECPSRCNPLQHPEESRARSDTVLDAMVANAMLNARTAQEAKSQPAVLRLSEEDSRAGTWFADWVAKEARGFAGSYSESVKVRTTLIPQLQQLAQQTVDEVLAGSGAKRGASQAALVAMEPDGAVVAMVGGHDYQTSPFNRAVDAKRQPGSAFKLFVYLAALRRGFTPNDTIDASPVDINGWRPENFSGRQYGQLTLADAFAHSVNTAAVRLSQDVGLNEVISAARDLGIESPLPAIPSLALGVADVSLLDLTAAFASVRADEVRLRPWGITGFEAANRLHPVQPPEGSGQSLGPYQEPLIELLQLVVQRGTGRAAALNGFAAGKTGTSENYRDAWFIGFNENLITGVWVGNDDDAPMDRVVGGSLPAETWKRFMTRADTMLRQEHVSVPPAGEAAAQSASDQAAIHGAYQACARAYESFRASDCRYQPYGGPRKLCEWGTQHLAQSPLKAPSHNPSQAP